MYSEIFLALAVSVDTYLAAVAYCNSEIKIPPLSAVIISFISAAILGLSLGFSGFISRFLPSELCETVGLIILIAIGMTAVFRSFIRGLVKKISRSSTGALQLSGFGLGVSIYLDETAADVDKSKTLSVSEAMALALASSLDSAATGFSCGFTGTEPFTAFLLTFFTGVAAIILGAVTGKKISSLRHDFSWVGGVILIAFAVASRIFHSS